MPTVEITIERVAITAHPLSSGSVTRNIMKLSDMQYSVGITNLAAYRNTGKFTCEQEGLYIISASVMSLSSGAEFYIYMNGNIISETYIAQNNNNNEKHTGAVTITQELNQNDKVWLYATGSFYLYGGLQSTLTIVKIK
ncbi:Hypothetical predicted protein [Mytilus galloprovincialis]|uniref:C1q domain-containing protein n=1 Tax=Mytilus galloprovincialis TaxID=29158 RepID=A0A8B6BZK0_MYTGA|nr:Hypothetical predicted protein [Mytilus galloprovincialis]